MDIMQNLSNNLPAFYKGLGLMGFGMTGIFIVLLILFACVKILLKFFPVKPEK